MPRLGSLLVCEKIIIDQQQKPSLISVFQSISAFVPEGQPIAENTLSFISWSIFAEWFFSEDETKKTIEQVVEVLHPDGSPTAITGRLTFSQFALHGQGTRAYVNLFGIPIAKPGMITINVWLESDSVKITEIFPYHIRIEHTSEQPSLALGGSVAPVFVAARPA
ncbi:MAG: hypothetical protein ABSD53_15485 [Terriglobales bacterium]|jgi:hypothetical protein